MKKSSLTLACVLCIVVLGSAPVAAREKGFRASFTGTALQSFDTDGATNSNGDTTDSAHGEATGTSNLGKFKFRSIFEVLPWDLATFCQEPDRGVPNGILLFYNLSSVIYEFSNGSQLFARLHTGSLCVDFTDGSTAYDTELEVVGGTGCFEGATGDLFSSGAGTNSRTPLAYGGVSGTTVGTLDLQKTCQGQ